MGPDEFHEKYPDAVEGGLRNNAYTNVMVAWLSDIAANLLAMLPASRAAALRARMGIDDEELAQWRDMSRRMFVPFHDDGIISQFEGYEDLAELDWDAYRAKYGNIQRLDRILHAEGDDPNRYKISKQADVVMLFFLFSGEELANIFQRLGYDYRADTARRNVEYYDRRTSHGSTLSFVTHAGVLAALDPDSSWERFMVALRVMSKTFRVAPRRKASTPVSCPGRSIWCSGISRAPKCVMASCISTLGFRASSTACPSPCNSAAAAFSSRSLATASR